MTGFVSRVVLYEIEFGGVEKTTFLVAVFATNANECNLFYWLIL